MGKPFGGMKSTGGGGAGAQSATAGFENFLANGINQGVFGGGNFGNAINSMLQGQVGDPNSLNAYFQNIQSGNGMAGPFQNFTPQSPGVANANFAAPQWQSQQFGNIDPFSGINPATLSSGLGTTAQLGSAGSANVDGEFGAAVREILNRQSEKAVGDLRARYGASGSGLGSNAQYAESNFRAEALPQIAAALGGINQQERGLNLQQRGQDLQNFYQGRGADISQMGLMGQQGANANNAILGMNQILAGQNNAMNQFNQGNAQFGSQIGLQAQGMNMDAINQMNQLNQNQNQFMNNYGLQNQQMGNQFAGMQAQTGLGLQQNQQQAQQFAIQQLMQALMQNQGLNTAQRQQVYQPGWVQQGLGAIGGIAGAAGQLANPLSGMMGALGGLFGGGGPQLGQQAGMGTAPMGYNQPMAPIQNFQPLALPVLR
jgi:hypothetical protein